MIRKSFSFVGLLTVLAMLSATAENVLAGGLVETDAGVFSAAVFTNPTTIDNPWWTLPAGSNFLYFAQDGDDCVWNLVEVQGTTRIPNTIDPPYAGTNVRIVLDRGWVDAECATYDEELSSEENFLAFIATDPDPEEATYDWYAQDDEKNIWYMGENSYDYEEESYEGSFTAGCDGAEAGIVILGDPSKGDFYSQEFYEDEAEDWGKVTNLDVCMKTKEWTPLESGYVEHKLYCPNGIGGELVLIEELHGSKTVIVELVATDIDTSGVPAVGNVINRRPQCPPYTGR